MMGKTPALYQPTATRSKYRDRSEAIRQINLAWHDDRYAGEPDRWLADLHVLGLCHSESMRLRENKVRKDAVCGNPVA